MRLFWLPLLLVVLCIDAKGLFDFKQNTLDTFNGARRLIASGALRTIIDVWNEIAPGTKNFVNLQLPKVGPAQNMYKLKWSAKLEHKALLYGENKSLLPDAKLSSFNYDGLVGFQWPGLLAEIINDFIVEFIPFPKIKEMIKFFVNMLEKLIMAFLLIINYPKDIPFPDSLNIGATEVLFAHRYEVGCYTKVTYSICFMEPSRNGGRLYEMGVPCSNCSTHCEFYEDDNGIIEEGDLCVPPETESNATSVLDVKQEPMDMESGVRDNSSLLVIFIFALAFLLN